MKKYNHKTLDFAKWNDLVDSSTQGLFYHRSEILTTLHKKWEFYVEEDQGNYTMGIALPVKKTFGLKRIIQPPFIQQLGIIGVQENEISFLGSVCLDQKDAFGWGYHFNEKNLSRNEKGFMKGTNLILDLNKPVEEIEKAYSKNLKRKLKLAQDAGLKFKECELEAIWPKIESELKTLLKRKMHPKIQDLKRALIKGQPDIKFFCTENNKGSVLSGAAFVSFKSRLTYWNGFSSPEGKSVGAMGFLMDQAIKYAAKDHKEFDFESGNLEGTKRFFSQFKPDERHYPIINRRLGRITFSE